MRMDKQIVVYLLSRISLSNNNKNKFLTPEKAYMNHKNITLGRSQTGKEYILYCMIPFIHIVPNKWNKYKIRTMVASWKRDWTGKEYEETFWIMDYIGMMWWFQTSFNYTLKICFLLHVNHISIKRNMVERKRFSDFTRKEKCSSPLSDKFDKMLNPFSSALFFCRKEIRTNYLIGAVLRGYLLMLISSYGFENKMSKETDLRISSQFTSRYSFEFSKKKKGVEHKYFLYMLQKCI